MTRLSSNSAIIVALMSLLLPVLSSAATHNGSAAGLLWDRDLAMQAAGQVDTRSEAVRLFQLARQANGVTTLRALIELSERAQWPEPAREAALYQFTNRLRELPPFSVDSTVLDFLLAYQNRVLVAREESPAVEVPLFPIRASAQGLINQWTREQSSRDAAELMASNPRQLVAVYTRSADPVIRAGIEQAVSEADKDALRNVLESGMPQLVGNPGLTGLMGKAALASGDVAVMQSVLVQGSGAPLVELSRQAGQQFSAAELGRLLLATMDEAPASTAALLIAELSPRALGQDGVGDAMIRKLGDPDLGSAAALAVARWGTDQQVAQLQAVSRHDPSSLKARRARTALSTRAENQGEQRQ